MVPHRRSTLVMHLILFPSYFLARGFSRVWAFVLNRLYHLRQLDVNCIRPAHVWAFPTLVLAHSFKDVVTVCLGRCQCKCEANGHRTRLWFAASGSCLYQLQLHLINFAFHFPGSPQLPSVEMLKFGLSEATVILP